ncbi:MAG: hypothetical protein FWC47_11605 [Oscillospiraceae bacterium]|nr:hypothetical protein [Oscillospiraceae bacterium]
MKDKRFEIRLSEKEIHCLDTNARSSKMTRSEYIRFASCMIPIATATSLAETIQILRDIYIELKRQGNNLNQVSKFINTYKSELEIKKNDILSQI